jgi:outer membrane protein TolC
MKKIILTLVLSLSILSGTASADEARHLSLINALEIARDRSLESVVADERVKQAVAKKGQAMAIVLPQVSLETYQRRQTRDLKAQGIPFAANTDSLIGPFNSFDARIKVTQMLVDIASVQRLFTVDALKRLSEAEYRKAQHDIMALTASLYTDAIRAQDKLTISRALEERERHRLWIAHSAWRSGRIKLYDLKQAKAHYKVSYAGFLNAQALEKEKISDLKVTLGFGPSEAIILDAQSKAADASGRSLGEMDADLSSHPDLEIKKLSLEEKQHERDIFLAEYWPKISTFADYGMTGSDPDDAQDTYTFGLQGTWALWDGGQRGQKVEEGKSAERSAAAVLLDTEKRLHIHAQTAFDMLSETKELLSAKNLNSVAAADKLKNISLQYQNGSASEWDYLNESIETMLIEDERAEAAAAYLLAKVNFYHSVGKMDEFIKSKV